MRRAVEMFLLTAQSSCEGAKLGAKQRIVSQNKDKKIYRAKHAKLAKKDLLSFRPKGEIFLRSLAFARDDWLRPVTLASFAFFARDINSSDLLFIPKYQISLARIIILYILFT